VLVDKKKGWKDMVFVLEDRRKEQEDMRMDKIQVGMVLELEGIVLDDVAVVDMVDWHQVEGEQMDSQTLTCLFLFDRVSNLIYSAVVDSFVDMDCCTAHW